jgi:hypothetical protein
MSAFCGVPAASERHRMMRCNTHALRLCGERFLFLLVRAIQEFGLFTRGGSGQAWCSMFQIVPSRLPVVDAPTFLHILVVVVGDVYVDEMDSTAFWIGPGGL